MSNKTSYNSIRMTKVILCLLLIIIFYIIHFFSNSKNREEVEDYIVEQMVYDNTSNIEDLHKKTELMSSYDICNNNYINSNNYDDFKYCIAHKK